MEKSLFQKPSLLVMWAWSFKLQIPLWHLVHLFLPSPILVVFGDVFLFTTLTVIPFEYGIALEVFSSLRSRMLLNGILQRNNNIVTVQLWNKVIRETIAFDGTKKYYIDNTVYLTKLTGNKEFLLQMYIFSN